MHERFGPAEGEMFPLGLAHGLGEKGGSFHIDRRTGSFERVQDGKYSFPSGVTLNSLLFFEHALLVGR